MSIRQKTILIIGITLIGLIIVVYGFSQAIFLNRFVQFEESNTRQSVRRAVNAMTDSFGAVTSTNQDWAHWTDDYEFVKNLNADFIDANLRDDTFVSYGLNIMLWIDENGKVAIGKAYDLVNSKEVPIPQSLLDQLAPDSMLLSHVTSDGEIDINPVTGILPLPEGPLFIVSSAILTTELTGPSRGSIVWARFLDAREIEAIAQKTQLSLSLRTLDDSSLPTDFKRAVSTLETGTEIVTEPLSSEQIAGYTLIPDIFGNKTLVFRIDTPRDIYAQGQASVFYFILAVIVVGLIFMVATLILLERIILSRVALLNREVSGIRISTDLSTRVGVSADDELSNLANTINQMLDALSQAHIRLEQTRDQALDALRLKAQIMANVSHDARTPLNIITLRVEMLQHALYGPVTQRQDEALSTIMVSASQLLFFINNLLDQAQLEAGKVKLEKIEVSTRELLTTLETSMLPMANKKGLALKTSIDADVPDKIIGDPNRLNQVVSNLVINAIKFTEQGKIEVRFRCPDKEHWALQVSDTGPGIQEDDRARIFEAFWQVDGSSTRKVTRGVGLGLSIVSQLTTLMGGQVSLQSEVGTGSTFTVVLPLESSQGEAENEKTLSPNH